MEINRLQLYVSDYTYQIVRGKILSRIAGLKKT